MKSRVVIEIDHHPGVQTVDNLVKWLDVMVPDLYAVRNYNIDVKVVEE